MSKWLVRQARRKDGTRYEHLTVWEVFDQDGCFSGHFDTWPEAMQWATDPFARMEYWLGRQVNR